MTAIQSLILGIIQGITELLPISSSGHLVLIPEILGWELQPTAFDITVHAGTLLALILYFRDDLINLFIKIKEKTNQKLILNLIITTIPAALLGYFFNYYIEENFKSTSIIVLMLILVGILMLFIDQINASNSNKISSLSPRNALVIGFSQVIAFIRGTSRSGITIIGGMISGLSRKEAARYAFLAGIPIMLGVSLMQFLEFSQEGTGEVGTMNLVIGFSASFTTSILTIRFLLNYLEKKGLAIFGIYRIILGLVIWLVL